jgi:hypothetical protein
MNPRLIWVTPSRSAGRSRSLVPPCSAVFAVNPRCGVLDLAICLVNDPYVAEIRLKSSAMNQAGAARFAPKAAIERLRPLPCAVSVVYARSGSRHSVLALVGPSSDSASGTCQEGKDAQQTISQLGARHEQIRKQRLLLVIAQRRTVDS